MVQKDGESNEDVSVFSRPLSAVEKQLWRAMFVRCYADMVYDPHFDFVLEHTSSTSKREARLRAHIHAVKCANDLIFDCRRGVKTVADKLGFKSEAHLMMRQALE